MSAEARAKMRALFIERSADPEFQRRRKEAMCGGKHSAGTIEKMRASARAAWARRRAEGRDKVNLSEEQRRANAVRLRQALADPEVEARRKSNAESRLERVRQTSAFRDAVSKGLKMAWKRKDFREKGESILRARWNDPEMAERIRLSKRSPKNLSHLKRIANLPKSRIRSSIAISAYHDKRRGFRVPAAKWAEYRQLVDRKKLPAAEAGRILGLV